MGIMVISIHNISAFPISTESFSLISVYHVFRNRTSVLPQFIILFYKENHLAIHPTTSEDGGILAFKC